MTPRTVPGRRAQAPHLEPRAVLEAYRAVRRASEQLAAPLSPEDCTAQSMPDASPVKWHLAHTSWFFETFGLETTLRGYRSFEPQFRFLFNSYYNTVGDQYPRPERGLITRPGLEQVRDYRAHVDAAMQQLLAGDPSAGILAVIELGLQHEQQHQELVLTDVKHLLATNPLRPVYRPRAGDGDVPAAESAAPRWQRYAERIATIGHDGHGFAFDNELPQHRVLVPEFELAGRPVTNGEYLEFVGDGGYVRPEHWLSDGWNEARQQGWRAPLYWEDRDGEWWTFTLAGMRCLAPDEPVVHLSFYEADAYARWAGARLPTEFEWEVAAGEVSVQGNFADSGRLHPAPAVAAGSGPQQLFGDVWEWTASAYAPYPGYRPAAGALGEYNGKFMCNQLVLRGGSCASPASHLRPTYRNFFPPTARWQFSGVRLARDADRAAPSAAR
jgi:ergothioneine biosynthesis protein EgtB